MPSLYVGRMLARMAVWVRRAKWSLRMKPSRRVIDGVHAQKQRLSENEPHVDRPHVSVIVQSFNQVRNVSQLEERLRAAGPDELIVCEDGSTDGSLEAWTELLTGRNDFLVRSNDLHEIRTYNRAIAFTQAEIICLMQDDDCPPKDGRWLRDAAELFDRYPKLAVLGGWCGFDNYFEREYNAPWQDPAEGEIPYADPNSGLALTFVENVNIGPYFLRKSTFLELGGFDLRFSAPGEPGITFESEFCYRAWHAGYQVALTDIPVKLETGEQGYIFPGGTTMWGLDARQRNEVANKALIRALYDPHLEDIRRAVRDANRLLNPASNV